MLAATTFLDALSQFAVIALSGLVVVLALAAGQECYRTWGAKRKAKRGLKGLGEVARKIRHEADEYKLGGADVEMFLLAALVAADTLDEARAGSLSAEFAPDPTDAQKFKTAVLKLAVSKKVVLDLRARLDCARRLLGATPVVALERVMAQDPKLRSPFATAASVTSYLLRCDVLDRAVAAAPKGRFRSR